MLVRACVLFDYLPTLEEGGGFEVTTQAFLDDAYLHHLSRIARTQEFLLSAIISNVSLRFFFFYKYDLIWIEGEIFPYLPAFFEWALEKWADLISWITMMRFFTGMIWLVA